MGKRIALALAFLLLCVAPTAYAQHIEYQEFLLHNAEAGNVGGVSMPVSNYTSVALDITISAAATVTFQASAAGGVFSGITCLQSTTLLRTTNVVSATASGLFQCNVAGFQSFRALISGNTGAVTVFARATTGGFQ